MRAQITPLPEVFERTIEVEAHVRRIQELIEKALSLRPGNKNSGPFPRKGRWRFCGGRDWASVP
jgi:hypothetical protein